MKVYISGAITGVKHYKSRFKKVERELKRRGYEVINPAEVNGKLPKSTSHDQYMLMSFVMLEMCDVMLVLPGYENSKGVLLELEFAEKHGINICFM